MSLSSGSDVTFTNGDLTFSGLQAVLPAGVALTAVFKNGTSAHATAVAQGAQTVGCDKTKFANWTWTEEAGELTDF